MHEALDRLLSPVSYATFVSDYWGKECLLNKGAPSRFSDLFEWSSLENLLSAHRFDFPRLRLVKKGRVVPAADYMEIRQDRRGNPFHTHISSAIAAEMKKGAMLHIAAVNDAWSPLASFAAALELDLNASVQVNLHAALARSKGFSTHWDGHDVFVIQVAGKKAWRLFGFTETAPLAVAPDKKGPPPQQYSKEILLETGDLLYVPRGYWHAAEALDDVSLHLTFAVQHPNGFDYLSWATRKLQNRLELRRDIPLFEDVGIEDRHMAYLDALKSIMIANLSSQTLQEFWHEYRSNLGRTNQVRLDGGEDGER